MLGTNVAVRGLDIPEVDWIVQYDPTDDPMVGFRGNGWRALVFHAGCYHPKRTLKNTINSTYFSGIKIDHRYALFRTMFYFP